MKHIILIVSLLTVSYTHLYRPGQTVYVSGLAYEMEKDSTRVLTDKKYTVSLYLLYERRRQRFSYLHFRRSAALGALRHRSGQRNLPLGRGMLLGTGML